jgi:hypothetical protein
MKLIKSVFSFFKFLGQRMSQSELELYIESKKPSTNTDVERLTREFHQKKIFRNFA